MKRCQHHWPSWKCESKEQWDITPLRMTIVKKTGNNKCLWGCGGKGSILTTAKNVNWRSHNGDSSKNRNRTTLWSSITLLGIYPKENKNTISKTCLHECVLKTDLMVIMKVQNTQQREIISNNKKKDGVDSLRTSS